MELQKLKVKRFAKHGSLSFGAKVFLDTRDNANRVVKRERVFIQSFRTSQHHL